MPSAPLAISDASLKLLLELSHPLSAIDRSSFLEDVAREFHGPEVGDGVVGRVAGEVQKRHLGPPPPEEMRKGSQSRIAGSRLSRETVASLSARPVDVIPARAGS